MDKLIEFLKTSMSTPTPFSGFHLVFMEATFLLALILVIAFKDANDKTIRKIIGIFYIVMVFLEIIKQIIFGYNLENHTFNFDWSAFPFQFCSCPYYIYPFLIFLPEGKIRNTLIAFSSTFVFFGGFGYFFFPVSFCGYLFINIQTMVHHGSMIIIGTLLLANKKDIINYKEVLKSTIVLVVLMAVAIILNVIVGAVLPGVYINLFELNPLIPTKAPVFADILNAVGYVLFLVIYVVGFLGFASIVYFSAKGIQKLINKIQNKKAID